MISEENTNIENFNPREIESTSDREMEKLVRPQEFSDFSGQEKVVENLKVFVKAAKMRGESLDHTLLFGPPGLGKTTLANIISNELGVDMKVTSGPILDKPGDLAGLLTSLEAGMCSLLTRFTACQKLWRSIFTPRWRISA